MWSVRENEDSYCEYYENLLEIAESDLPNEFTAGSSEPEFKSRITVGDIRMSVEYLSDLNEDLSDINIYENIV